MNQLVSIIIPVYNVEKYIRNCLESVINQTVKNIEIIVIIDGSLDNSSNIVYGFAKKDKRIKVIDRENKGVLYSRIEGVQHSNGEYIVFLDGDDTLMLNSIEIMIQAITLEQADIVKGNYIKQLKNTVIKNKSYVTEKKTFSKAEYEPFIYDLLYQDIYFNSMCYCMIRKQLLTDISLEYDLKYGEDLITMLELILKSNKITIIPEYIYNYNINENGITLTKNEDKMKKKITDTIKVYNRLFDYVDIYEITNKEYYRELANTKLLFYLTMHFLNLFTMTKNYKKAFEDLQNSLKNIDIKKINKEYLKKYNVIYRISIQYINHYYILRFISILYKYFK